MRLSPLWLVALVACTSRLEIPTDGARVVLLTTTRDDEAVMAEAISIGDRQILEIDAPDDGDRLYASDYACGLAGLGIGEGPVGIDPTRGYAMPEPQRLRRLERDALTTVEAPPELVRARYTAAPPLTACRSFVVSPRLFEETGKIAAILPKGPGLLIVSELQLFFVWDLANAVPAMVSWGGMPAYGATEATDGSYWFAGSEGRVTRREGETAEDLPPFPGRVASSFGRMWISVADAEARSIFLLSDQGDLGYYDGSAWTVLHSTRGSTIALGSVAAIGPRDALITGLADLERGSIGRVIDGRYESQPIDVGGTPIGRVLIVKRLLGTIYAGTETGAVLVLGDGAWSLAAKITDPVQVIETVEGIVVAGGRSGTLRQVGPGTEPCEPLLVDVVDPSGDPADISQLVAIDRRLVTLQLRLTFPDPLNLLSVIEVGPPIARPRCDPE
jgi:hypothetical protein